MARLVSFFGSEGFFASAILPSVAARPMAMRPSFSFKETGCPSESIGRQLSILLFSGKRFTMEKAGLDQVVIVQEEEELSKKKTGIAPTSGKVKEWRTENRK